MRLSVDIFHRYRRLILLAIWASRLAWGRYATFASRHAVSLLSCPDTWGWRSRRYTAYDATFFILYRRAGFDAKATRAAIAEFYDIRYIRLFTAQLYTLYWVDTAAISQWWTAARYSFQRLACFATSPWYAIGFSAHLFTKLRAYHAEPPIATRYIRLTPPMMTSRRFGEAHFTPALFTPRAAGMTRVASEVKSHGDLMGECHFQLSYGFAYFILILLPRAAFTYAAKAATAFYALPYPLPLRRSRHLVNARSAPVKGMTFAAASRPKEKRWIWVLIDMMIRGARRFGSCRRLRHVVRGSTAFDGCTPIYTLWLLGFFRYRSARRSRRRSLSMIKLLI